MQAGKFNFWQGDNAVSSNEVVLTTLTDGDKLVLLGGSYLIKTGANSYRGIDEKFDHEAILYIANHKRGGGGNEK